MKMCLMFVLNVETDLLSTADVRHEAKLNMTGLATTVAYTSLALFLNCGENNTNFKKSKHCIFK